MAAQIFVVSGASGSGKTTLVKGLLVKDRRLRFAVSYTTRPARPGEVDGRDYCFVPEPAFIELLREGSIIEHVKQFGYYYGTSRTWIHEALHGSRDIIFDVEIQGARVLKAYFPQATFIFILPPTAEVLEERLRARGSLSEAELRERLDRVRREISEASYYNYLIVNDDLSLALAQLQAVVTAARCRTNVLWPTLAPHWS